MFNNRDHAILLQLKITESMRRREGLMEQKAGLLSANETLEKEVMVSYVCMLCCTTFVCTKYF